MNRRTFLASIPALARLGCAKGMLRLGPTSTEVEQAFLGGLLRNPHCQQRFRQVPTAAFSDERSQLVWALLRALGHFGAEVGVEDLESRFDLLMKLQSRPGGHGYLRHLLAVAAPVRRLPELADELTRDTDPRPVEIRQASAWRWGLGRTGFRTKASWTIV